MAVDLKRNVRQFSILGTHSHTELAVIAPATAPAKVTTVKRFAQMAGSALLSVGLVGTFALPSYATTPNAGGTPDGEPMTQTLTTVSIDADVPALEASTADYDDTEDIEAARLAAEEEAEAAALAAEAGTEEEAEAAEAPKLPAGKGSSGLASAALAQLGVSQDCTDMVQNALAAIGLTERRDQGGYDHGVGDFYRYGTPVPLDQAQAGDILIYGGHVAIYIGNNQAVHGGWSGNNTMIDSATAAGTPTVIRVG